MSRLPKGTTVEWQFEKEREKVKTKYNKNSARNNELFLQGNSVNVKYLETKNVKQKKVCA